MKDYELIVSLIKGSKADPEEWQESTMVEAKNMAEAHKMARLFAREQAEDASAKIVDYFAIDENGEYSD
jgi:hypothetical protein